MTTLLAQLTDLHIRAPGQLTYRRIDTAAYLQRAVRQLQVLPQRPHALVLTGDLTDFGRPDEYAHLRALLAPLAQLPVFLLPGNHDERAGLRAAFPEHAYLGDGAFIQYAVRIGGLRLIALDTVVPGQSYGALCAERLHWLAAELARDTNVPTVIAMHHPPFRTMIGHMDKLGLLSGAGELEEIVAAHPNIERVICGHMHRSIQTVFGGTLAMTSPAPAHQVVFDLDADAAAAWNLEPPALMVHALPGDGRLVSHTVAIGEFDGPHPFWDADGRLID